MVKLIVYLCLLGADSAAPCVGIEPVIVETRSFAECDAAGKRIAAEAIERLRAEGRDARAISTLCTTR